MIDSSFCSLMLIAAKLLTGWHPARLLSSGRSHAADLQGLAHNFSLYSVPGERGGSVDDNYTSVSQCEHLSAHSLHTHSMRKHTGLLESMKRVITENFIIWLVSSFAWTVWFYSSFMFPGSFLGRDWISRDQLWTTPLPQVHLFTFEGVGSSKKVNELLKLFQVIKVRNVEPYNLEFCLPFLLSNQNIKIIADTG